MPATLKEILDVCTKIAKENFIDTVACPCCGEQTLWIRYGYYTRYLFSGGDLIAIQRYLCLNRNCPRKTFYILPFTMLHLLRVSLCFLLVMACRVEEPWACIASLARESGKAWGVMRRTIRMARNVKHWMQSEYPHHCCRSSVCGACRHGWTGFTRAFSFAVFPVRFGNSPPTQCVYS